MKIKPIKKGKAPNYPTIEHYVEHPELLSKNIPESWMRNKYVATSLATFILLGNPKTRIQTNQIGTEILDKINSEVKDNTISEVTDSFKIAPIFAHGDGAGATGCVVMSPPVFIPEDEAKKIIFNKLAEEGFTIDTVNTESIEFKTKQIAISCIGQEELSKYPEVEVKMKLDGYESNMKLAIEFVSVDDYQKFAEKENLWGCSVTEYDTKKAAEIIREELVANGKTNAVIFYDPITSIDFERNNDWRKSEIIARKDAEKLLLEQVEDFIKWFKKENIIEK